MILRRRSAAILLLALAFVLPLFLAGAPQEPGAEKAGEQAGEAAQGGGGSDMIGKIINFVILFGGLFLLLRKPLAALLTRRTEAIARTLSEAEEARREAERKLEEARVKVDSLEAEIQRLGSAAEADAGRETERIRDLARKEAERLRELARLEIDAYLKAGIRELKEHTAALAAALAEARLKDRLTPDDQTALIDRSIEKLKTIHEESDSR